MYRFVWFNTVVLLSAFGMGSYANPIHAPLLSAHPPDYAAQKFERDAAFLGNIQAAILECQKLGLNDPATRLGQFAIQRDPRRQYIFIPPENRFGDNEHLRDLPPSIQQSVQDLLANHADALFELAKQQTSTNAAAAFQWLHEVLHFQPDHSQVRRILGHRLIGEYDQRQWQVQADRFRIRQATKPQEQFGWPAQSYWLATTSHFHIESTASAAEIEFLARRLERWHGVWRQVFFEYYNHANNLNRWIDDKGSPTPSRRKHHIVFFADRQQYVKLLQPAVPQVDKSTGYYNDSQQTSYFFASQDASIHETWIHELTHQLLQESQKTVRSPFEHEFLWLGEGIAMYFESLVDHQDYVTLGGFDARRLQFARLRRLKEQFFVPMERLSQMDMGQYQTHRELAKLYGQSAGIAHYLMTAEQGRMQQPLIEFLRLIYRGRLKPGTFEKLIGQDFATMDREYQNFLRIQSGELSYLSAPLTRRELILVGSPLFDTSLEPLSACRNLHWLDLSGCDVRGARLAPLVDCQALRQLYLSGSKLDVPSAAWLAKLPLEGLDVSGSNWNDQMAEQLATNTSLTTLNLDATRIGDQGLISLSTLSTLSAISLVESAVSEAGIQRLRQLRPDLQVSGP